MVADWNPLKEQFKQQFNPVGNTREEQMASWRNIKWDGNETLDDFSYRVTKLGKVQGLNNQHILDTFKLGLPSNIYVNLVHIDGIDCNEYGKMTWMCQKELHQGQVLYQTFHLWQLQAMRGWPQIFIKSQTHPNS